MICIYCVQLAIAAVVMALGLAIAWKPKKFIDAEIAVYRLINWKMEPVSMEKEVRNTRIMGLVLFIFGIAGFVYIIVT